MFSLKLNSKLALFSALLLTSLLLSSIVSAHDIYIGGLYNENTTWAHHSYVVTSDITIDGNLTISSGVTIDFTAANRYKITDDGGTISINGTSGSGVAIKNCSEMTFDAFNSVNMDYVTFTKFQLELMRFPPIFRALMEPREKL